jgi:hypothetical protein
MKENDFDVFLVYHINVKPERGRVKLTYLIFAISKSCRIVAIAIDRSKEFSLIVLRRQKFRIIKIYLFWVTVLVVMDPIL